MPKPLILKNLWHRVQADLAELGAHAPTAAEAMQEAHGCYESVGCLIRDLYGLGMKRHYFHLTSDERIVKKGDGRYVFRQIHTDDIPEAYRPKDYVGDVLIPIWIGYKKQLIPNYQLAKDRIAANREKLYLREDQAPEIRPK